MILAAAFALCLLTVPLLGGHLSRLALVPIRRRWSIMAALAIQVLIISIIPAGLPSAVAAGFHLASYALTLVFVAANWRIPGMVILVAGGLCNLVAIGANGGVMPASERALEVAGRAAPVDGFINSKSQDGAHLLFLGDIFALPEGVPFANVFSIGDVLLVVGGTVIAHRAGGSSLPWRRHPAAPGPDGESGTGPGPDRPSADPVPVGRSSDESVTG